MKTGTLLVLLVLITTDAESVLGANSSSWISKPIPASGVINGFLVGTYPPQGDRPTTYAAPKSLIEITQENQAHHLSPHFQAYQFLCKQEGGWPKYLTVSSELLAMLESIVTVLKQQGIELDTLTIMSGYRTPAYNKSLGNVAYSRHIYGDAADIFVDTDGDDIMDDLNKDGVSDIDDALWLLTQIEQHAKTSLASEQGGLGAYPANAYHGPFLHVDTRGTKARWGPAPEH